MTVQTPGVDLSILAQSDEEIWLEANERLRISIEANGKNVTEAIEDLEFEDGHQWPDDLYNLRKVQRRPSLTINMTRRCVREVCNNMRQQRPRIKVHPTGDGAQKEDAQIWAGVIRDIENQSNADHAYDVAGEAAVKAGWGYARVVSEYIDERSMDQRLCIRPVVNQFTVYDDPSALNPSGSDREWLLVTQTMKRSEYKRKYPKAENVEFRKGQPGDDDRLWESEDTIRLAEYFRIYRKKATLHSLVGGGFAFEDELQPHQRIDENGEKRDSFKRVVQWFKLNGRKIYDRRVIPGRFIPFSRCTGNVMHLNGEVRYRGMVRDLKDTNRMLNYWETCNTELIALAPRPRFIAAEGQVDGHPEWKDYNQKATSVLVYKPVTSNPEDPNSPVLPPPQLTEPVQVQAALVDAVQRAHQDLLALAGMPHEPRADLPGAVVSGRALRERQAATDRSHFQYYDNQTQFIEHIGEILVEQIPHYYTGQRVQRIIGEDGVPSMITVNQPQPDPEVMGAIKIKNSLITGKFDIVMDVGPGYETKRQEGTESMLALLETPLGEPVAKTGADIVIRNMDFAGADDLADRLMPTNGPGFQKAVQNLPREAQAMVMGISQQLQAAQQKIQQLELEAKYRIAPAHLAAVTKAHDTEIRAKTAEHDTETRAATELQKAHIDAVTKRDVAEIQVGGKLLDSHVQGAHALGLAKETAKAAEKAEKGNGKGSD